MPRFDGTTRLGFVYGCGMFHKCLWFDYGCGMFHNCLWHGYGCGMFHRDYDLVVVCSTRGMFHTWYVLPGLVSQRSVCCGTLSGDPAIEGAMWQCPNKLV